MTTVTEGLQTLKLEQIHESPWNPRKHFDVAKLNELAASIETNGIIEPLLARPNARGVELAAGARRYRAAKIARLEEAPVMVRAMTDQQFLEVLMIDNLQREDFTPLEEAEGYQTLIRKAGYDVTRIAERVGRSEKYVYDRVKLLALGPVAQQLLRGGEITAGHAILLARLKPLDQQKLIDHYLFEEQDLLWEKDDEPETRSRKAISVRELQARIDEHVKFDLKAIDPVLFPATVSVLSSAQAHAEKILPITYDYVIQEDARDGERVFTERSWKRADGQVKSKTCDFAVTGVIVVGPGRGEAFKVCTNKDKCRTHWAAEQREKAKRATSTSWSGSSAADRQAKERQRYEQDQAREEIERGRWRKAVPAILEAVEVKVRKAPTGAGGLLADTILGDLKPEKSAADFIPRGKSAEDFVRHAAFAVLHRHGRDDWKQSRETFTKRAKAFGVDIKKILDEVAPLKEAKPAAKK